MGSTILLGKKAAVFRRPDTGKVVYALFEQTCETNCRPQTPDWSCIALGEYSDVMRHVFLGASCCEGGSLKSRAGHIKPENYIEAVPLRTLPSITRLAPISLRKRVEYGTARQAILRLSHSVAPLECWSRRRSASCNALRKTKWSGCCQSSRSLL